MQQYLGIKLEGNPEFASVDWSDLEIIEKVTRKIRLSIIKKHITNGVIFKCLDDIYIDNTVIIGKGTVIDSDNHLIGNTVIGNNCVLDCGNILEDATIGSEVKIIKSVIRNCKIGAKTTVGPFANLHTNSRIEKECRIGNFVEIKNATIGINTKMAHLAYIGDVDIGNQCNIGCGSIFVNYDGKNKHRSSVGDSVFVGSNSNVIAPVRIEDNAYIAAGTTVTVDLPKNCMCIGRNRETIKENRSKYIKNNFNKKYFGTDGIRGIYGEDLTDRMAFLCGNFLGYSSDGGKVVIGRDNRISGESLANAMIEGIKQAGAEVIDLGVITTPCVAFVTTHICANYGIVISASHNPWQYNGIKVFNYDGRKLTSIEEVEIEQHIDSNTVFTSEKPGKVVDGKEYVEAYVNDLKTLIGNLNGLKVVIDCANGASAKIAPQLFKDLGAEVYAFNTSPDGRIINENCGALHPEFAAQKVKELNANMGFTYDGDADRLLAINEKGKIVDGDSIIYIAAKMLKERNALTNDAVVGTLYTNMGVEQSLKNIGIKLLRTDVGDHFVIERMLRDNLLVGGEQSGHIILRELANTGDGVLASLYLCKIMKNSKKTLLELDDSVHFPQVNMNLITQKKNEIMLSSQVTEFIEEIEKHLAGRGRILIRASGTEPKIRIMAECVDKDLAQDVADKIKNFLEKNFI